MPNSIEALHEIVVNLRDAVSDLKDTVKQHAEYRSDIRALQEQDKVKNERISDLEVLVNQNSSNMIELKITIAKWGAVVTFIAFLFPLYLRFMP